MSFSIPKSVMESIQTSLMAHGRLYLQEIAKHLNVNPKELIQNVLPYSEKVTIGVTQHTELQCKSLVVENSILRRCRKPVASTSPQFCKDHVEERLNAIRSKKCIDIIRLQDSAERQPLWKRGSDVINSYGTKVGVWNDSKNRLVLYVIKKSTEELEDCI